MEDSNACSSSLNDSDDIDTVSMIEVIEQEDKLQAEVTAVLGNSDYKHCTYPSGYVTRQAVYSCNTCKTRDNLPAGICLACSYACHEGHDLLELYTKRRFRCDCGNSKFLSLKCSFFEIKDNENTENVYNQNFSNLYCTCSRPYPDLDDEIPDEMIQCFICEDWFHGRHIGTETPPDDNYEEMACSGCMHRLPWLWAYSISNPSYVKIVKSDDNENVDPCASTETPNIESHSDHVMSSSQSIVPSASNVKDQDTCNNESKTNDKNASESSSCILKELQARDVTVGAGGVFWPAGWREKLCRCGDCMKLYKDNNIPFITDIKDSVKYYEDCGQEKMSSRITESVNTLQNMDRVVLGEVMHGFNDLKTSLTEYLQKFADNKKVVREEDIREFFTQMEARKKRRLDNMPPTFCK